MTKVSRNIGDKVQLQHGGGVGLNVNFLIESGLFNKEVEIVEVRPTERFPYTVYLPDPENRRLEICENDIA